MARQKKVNVGLNSLNKLTKLFSEAKNQAKIPAQVLRVLEERTWVKAKSLIQAPTSEVRKALTNERILNRLKKVGVATENEVETLRARIAQLEAELAQLRKPKAPRATASASSKEETTG